MVWQIIVPPHTLHEPQTIDEVDALANSLVPARIDRHFKPNLRQLCGIDQPPHGERRMQVTSKPGDIKGVMLLQDIEWIKKDGDDEYVAVVPYALDKFLLAHAARADIGKPVMSEASLRKLINGNLKSNGVSKDTYTKFNWKWMKEGPPDPLRWLEGAHRSGQYVAQAEARVQLEHARLEEERRRAEAAESQLAEERALREAAEQEVARAREQAVLTQGAAAALASAITAVNAAAVDAEKIHQQQSAALAEQQQQQQSTAQLTILSESQQQQGIIAQQQADMSLLITENAELRQQMALVSEQAVKALVEHLKATPKNGTISFPISGGRLKFQRIVETRISSGAASDKTNQRRATTLRVMREELAGGDRDDTVALLVQDARSNSTLFRQVGIVTRVEMSLRDARGVRQELTGVLGNAWARHMKACGVRMPTRDACRAADKQTWHDSETGKIVLDDPKRPGKMMTAAYVRIKNLLRLIQRTLRLQAANGLLIWPEGVPADEVWCMISEDKGGASDKLLLSFVCVRNPSCVYNTVLLAMLDQVKPQYEYILIAFGPIYEQMSEIMRCGRCVRATWRQFFPMGYIGRDEDGYPISDPRDEAAVLRLRRRQAKEQGEIRMLEFKRPSIPKKKPRLASVPLLLGPADPLAGGLTVAPSSFLTESSALSVPLLLGPVNLPSRSPVGNGCDESNRTPQTEAVPSEAVPVQIEAIPMAIDLPMASATLAAQSIASSSSAVAPISSSSVVDLDEPPSTCRPSCSLCADPRLFRTSGRYPGSFPGCPTAKREALYRNGSGRVRPYIKHGEQTAPRRLRVYSATCPVCRELPNGRLQALRRQWEECTSCDEDKLVRILFGGDMLSVLEAEGHGGPGSKEFCLHCHARLHESNPAGTIHHPDCPDALEVRPPHLANPLRRAGSAQMEYQSSALALAEKEFALGERKKKPSPMDFDSCLHKPLIYFSGPSEGAFSLYPLHEMLGITLDLVNKQVALLKKLDAQWAAACGRTVGDAKLRKLIESKQAEITTLTAQTEHMAASIADLTAAMELITDNPDNAPAVKLAMGRKKKDEEGVVAQFRSLRTEMASLQKAFEKDQGILKAEHKALVELWSKDAGPFMRSLYSLFDSLRLERQAHHSNALTGNDCATVLLPHVATALSQLSVPRLVGCELSVGSPMPGETLPRVQLSFDTSLASKGGIGDATASDNLESLLHILGESVSLWTRKEALCEHEIERFRALSLQFATEYADAFPDQEATPKLHTWMYHLTRQMGWLGGSGLFHEGVLESKHVRDNELVRRFRAIYDPEKNIQARLHAHHQSEAPDAMNIRLMDQERETRRRDHRNADTRLMREAAVRDLAERRQVRRAVRGEA